MSATGGVEVIGVVVEKVIENINFVLGTSDLQISDEVLNEHVFSEGSKASLIQSGLK